MFQNIIRPILFQFSPETAHHLTAFLLRVLMKIPGIAAITRRMYQVNHPKLIVEKKGLRFPNPVGLAAGFDKNATLFPEFQHLGFGFIEVGTVTPLPQPGNPKPRLFRLPNDQALINRMGFNNDGVEEMVKRLKKRPENLIIGGNIGKNKITSEENAHNDYLKCFHALYEHVDYIAINVSSPNTPGLRNLQGREPLQKLLSELMLARKQYTRIKPILLKISPDLNNSQLSDVADMVKQTQIDGVIATNTTISRDGLQTKSGKIDAIGDGGLSGWPLKARSTRIVSEMRHALGNDFLIVGCGGIAHPEDALEKLQAGADLVQLYTGFIYSGPRLVKNINKLIIKA